MSRLADAFIALPGGFGTIEEVIEAVTWTQLGIHAKPVGLLDVDGYFDHLVAFLDRAVDDGLLKPAQPRPAAVATTTPIACSSASRLRRPASSPTRTGPRHPDRGRPGTRPPQRAVTSARVELPVLPPVAPMLAKAVDGLPVDDGHDLRAQVGRLPLHRVPRRRRGRARQPQRATAHPLLPRADRSAARRRCRRSASSTARSSWPASDGLDFEALQQRIHPAASRVARLSDETPASFVAFDLLAARRPIAARHAAAGASCSCSTRR